MPHTHHPIEILRFNTCGSVDDGKSTLIGRLLYDSKNLMEDQLEALERSADLTGGGAINLANLTDGLRAEREQGITIDVAYRYFATPRRKFIVADTPGHVQYTRNMVTGASTANLSIVPVQWVNRPHNPRDPKLHDFRGLSGQIAGGIVRVGQKVMVLPSGWKSTVKDLWTYDGSLPEAFCPQSITLVLDHDLDISRGDTIIGLENLPGMSSEFRAKICWMNQRPV